MEIRVLRNEEILPALHLAWEVFIKDVAPSYQGEEGIHTFADYIKYDNIMKMIQNRELILFGAVDGAQVLGMLGLKASGHIPLFFVKSELQGRGIGQQIFRAMQNYSQTYLSSNRITLNAATGSVVQFQKMGMYPTGAERVENGMRFVSMEMPVFHNPYFAQTARPPQKHRRGLLIGLIIGGAVLFLVMMGLLTNTVYNSVKRSLQDGSYQYSLPNPDSDEDEGGDDSRDHSDDYDSDDSELEKNESQHPLQDIKAYTKPGTVVSASEESYTKESKETDSNVIDFQVKYPQLKGMSDQNVQKKINETLMKTAKDSVSKLYENPTPEMKEKILTADQAVLVSYVDYKVTFLSDDFVSVVFNDNSYMGSTADFKTHLRCVNISLKDGTVYQAKDILNLSDKFLDDFRSNMQLETGKSSFLSDVEDPQLQKALQGEDKSGKYTPEFFVDSEGIEVGFDITYAANDYENADYSWVTAPFKFKEIKEYKNENEFWSYLAEFLN